MELAEQGDMSRVSGFPVTYKGTGRVTKYWHYLRGDMECSREAEVTFTAKDDHTCELSLVTPMMVMVPEGEEKLVCGTNGEFEVWSMQGAFDPVIQYCVFTTCNGTTNHKAEGRLGYGANGPKSAKDLACVLVKSGKTDAKLVVHTMAVVK